MSTLCFSLSRHTFVRFLVAVFRSDSSTMQHATEGTIFGPVWLTNGEPFRPVGAFEFLRNRHREFVSYRDERRAIHREVLLIIDERTKRKQRKDERSEDESSDDELKIKNLELHSMNRRELDEYRQVKSSSDERKTFVELRFSFRNWKKKSKRQKNNSSCTENEWTKFRPNAMLRM